MSIFYKRLKEIRNELGLTQPVFADIAGVSLRAQASYEKGERTPDSEYLENLYKAGIDVDYIIKGTRNSESPLSRALIDAFFSADELTQQMIAKLLGMDLAALQNLQRVDQGSVGDNNIINSPGSGNRLKININKKREK